MPILIIIKKNILNKKIMNYWIDLTSHLYYLILDIKKFHSLSRKVLRKIRIINLYENKFDKE